MPCHAMCVLCPVPCLPCAAAASLGGAELAKTKSAEERARKQDAERAAAQEERRQARIDSEHAAGLTGCRAPPLPTPRRSRLVGDELSRA